MKNTVCIFLLSLLVLFPAVSHSCDLCGCFLPSDSREKGFLVGVAEQFTNSSDLFLNGESLKNRSDQYLNSSYSQLLINYHFNPGLALQASIPLIHRSYRRLEEKSLQQGTESGIGDVLLAGYYIPYQRRDPFRQFRWRVLAGLKFPTGNSARIEEELQEVDGGDGMSAADMGNASAVHGHDLALGSGSWDGIFGTDLFGRSGKWFYTARVQYMVRGRGDFDYRYGNDVMWQGGPGYYARTGESWALGFQGVVSGEHKGEDDLSGQKADDTSMSGVYVGPTAIVAIRKIAVAEIGVGLPVWRSNTGLQTLPGYRLQIGITWQLN